MREVFVRQLTKMATKDKDLMLITGDLGYNVLTNFAKMLPNQFINAGIAEQNMTGVATGLALEGKIVFTYSIANFPTLRCLEQIRNDAAYHNANVKIVSVGAGFNYGTAGMSHHATEDIAIMRALPNVVVLCPGDNYEVEQAVKLMYEWEGTCYLRLGKGGEKSVHKERISFNIGQAIKLIDGNNIAIFSTGEILVQAELVTRELNDKGISTALYSFPTIKPIDKDTIFACTKKHDLIVTLEEHNVIGGFGGAVAEVISEIMGNRAMLVKIGLQDIYSSVVGDQQYLREYYGLSKDKILERILEVLELNKNA